MNREPQPWLPAGLSLVLAVTAGLLLWRCLQAAPPVSAHQPTATTSPLPRSPSAGPLPAIKSPNTSARSQPAFSGFGSKDEYQYALDHPEYLALCIADYSEDIAVEYAPLFRILGIPAADRAAVLQALVQKRLVSIVHADLSPQDRFAAWKEIDGTLKAKLTPKAYATCEWYTHLPPAGRYSLMTLGERMTFSGHPLSLEQERTVWGTVQAAFEAVRTNPSAGTGAHRPIADFYETAILDDALLNPLSARLDVYQMQIAFHVMHQYADQKKNLKLSPPQVRTKYH